MLMGFHILEVLGMNREPKYASIAYWVVKSSGIRIVGIDQGS